MDDLDFFEDDDQDEIEDLDFPIDPYDDMLIDDTEYVDDSDDNCILDQEFIDNHLNVVPSEVLHNFPFVEDDVDAITDYELFSKGFGYLDENKVNKDELSDVAYTGDYNDLSNKPNIPDVSEYVKKDTTELENYPLTSSLSSVAFSGDYDDLSNKPTIPTVPTNVSAFTNDAGYINKDVNDLTYYTKTADLPSVPTKTSDLTNDSGFITNSVNNLTNYPLTSSLSSVAFSGDYDDLSDKPVIPTVPTNVSAFTNDAGYITKNVNDLTNYTLTTNLSTVATSGNYNDLSNKPTIPTVPTNVSAFTNDAGYITKSVNDLTYYTKTADLPSVPTKTSDLTNDSGFITNSVNNLTNYPLTSSLSSVAFSGDYDDLSDKPTIPSVGNAKLWYGISTTGASTQTKVVVCDGFTLETGSSIVVTFSTAQTYNGQPKLNVNNTGAISIQYKSGTAGIRYMWNAGSTIQFIYDGTNWICEGRDLANTTYYGVTKLNNTVTSTSTTLAATANSVKVTYDYAATKQDAITSTNKLDYSLIDNTPTIPDSTSDLTNDSGFITNSVNDLTNYTLTSNLSTVATSGNYNDLSNKPTIPTVPTNVSAFTNDAGYITKSVNDLTNYTDTTTLTSLLANKENVIDVVTNSNGTCIKLDSGIAIQYGTYSYSNVSITNGYGSIYYALPTNHIEFPVSFINSNYSFNATEKTTRIGGLLLNTKDASYVTLKVWQGINEGAASFDANWIAIGLWK